MNLLEHIEEPVIVLRERRRVLEESGTLVGVVPFLFPIDRDTDVFWRYTPSSLSNLLESTDSEIFI